MTSPKRLIEVAFPLKQTSLDSVHEKNVRHGHISTLHIWPARRPLAASRAALIATLLPDPEDDAARKDLLERLAGRVVERPKKKKQADGRMVDELAEETEGGILHWGRESGPDLDFFRKKIREAYGGRAPRVLDPFSGGGAIPLEAMRLGCEATAVDINPVAWFILKCTLEYPQKLAGQTRPLPSFALADGEFMESFLKARGLKGKSLVLELEKLGFGKSQEQQLPGFATAAVSLEADLAWHVRAWGRWVLAQARRDLARYYPTYADFEPLVEVAHAVERRPLRLVPLKGDGTPDVETLNADFGPAYLADKQNPRWVAKPSIAYLWARTVTCKNCGALIPLLKTRWLAKKDKKRVLLTMTPLAPEGRAGQLAVQFAVQTDVPVEGRTSAERIAHDKQIGGGTVSRSGIHCPICNQITMTTEDIRLEGQAGRLGAILVALFVEGANVREYRLPTEEEIQVAENAKNELIDVFSGIPFGIPNEPLPAKEALGFRVPLYGVDQWYKLFTHRQNLMLGTFVKNIRSISTELASNKYDSTWIEAITAFLICAFDRMLDFNSKEVTWMPTVEAIGHTFVRFALPITWDYSEPCVINYVRGGWQMSLDAIAESLETINKASFPESVTPNVIRQSAKKVNWEGTFDAIVTDPPYYDAIPYSDLMDYFYVWLKRNLYGSLTSDEIFTKDLSPKWDTALNDGELIDDSSRFAGNNIQSKQAYEDGMFDVFQACNTALTPDGRLVIVFAHKNPNAWETLVSAIIRAGFVVDGSWPIQTEQFARIRAQGSAALSSSVWLVCKKRPESARPGWDNRVLDEMRANITLRLRQFWDAGIRGPDFVWAATGPALEAYSQYPAVKKANQPGELMAVGEFLTHVRRMVVDFVVGRVLTTLSPMTSYQSPTPGDGVEDVDVSSLDSLTTYYLLHRNDFGLEDAPAGPCILYAVSCGLSDGDLADRYDLLARRGGKASDEEEPEEDEEGESASEGTGSVFRLKAWNLRKRPNMGFEPGEDQSLARLPLFPDLPAEVETRAGNVIPLIDQVHRLMHLWRAGDVTRVDDYLERRALRRNQLFHQLLQALIELSTGEERSLLESISNHVGAGGKQASKLF